MLTAFSRRFLWEELAVVSVAVVPEQFFETVKAVRLEVARICLVLTVFELLYFAFIRIQNRKYKYKYKK